MKTILENNETYNLIYSSEPEMTIDIDDLSSDVYVEPIDDAIDYLTELGFDEVHFTGYNGLWDGHHEIVPFDDTIDNIFNKMTRVRWDYIIRIYLNEANDKIIVHQSHHDGTNVYTMEKEGK